MTFRLCRCFILSVVLSSLLTVLWTKHPFILLVLRHLEAPKFWVSQCEYEYACKGIKNVGLLKENEIFFGIVRQMTRYVRDGSNQGKTPAKSYYKHVYNLPNDADYPYLEYLKSVECLKYFEYLEPCPINMFTILQMVVLITLMGVTISLSHVWRRLNYHHHHRCQQCD